MRSRPPLQTTHGLSNHPMYLSWRKMRERVRTHPKYQDVTIDPRWATFDGFIAHPPTAADGRPWERGLCLSRINDTGPYSPENARWRTRSENQRESVERTAHRLPDGRIAIDVARENGVSDQLWWHRIARGWTTERAVLP